MSENGQASIGQVLRDARESQGMSVDDAANRLRLMHRQIEAMETDDFESLGQSVFARGFVRNYARLLGLAPEELLARMAGASAEPAPVNNVEPPLPRTWLSSPWLMLLLLGVLAMVAVPVGLYLWLNSEVDDSPNSVVPVATHALPTPAEAQPVAAAPDTPAATTPPDVPASDAGEASADVAAAGTAASPPAAPPAAAAPVVPAAPAITSVMHLEFGEESWVEIKDASGRMLQRQLNPAGSSVDIQGQPPFDVVIGNAAQARMTYNGRPIDLKPFIAVTVARFTLEE